MAATSGELVWLGTSESALGGDALLALAAALDSDPQAGRAVPHPDPGAYAMVTREGGARTVLVRGAGARRERRRLAVRGPSFGPALVETVALSVGPATYASPGCVLRTYAPTERIELGGYCSIAHDVRLVNPGGALHDADGAPLHPLVRGEHRPQCASTFPIGVLVPDAPFDEVPPGAVGPALVVGDDVWIGTGALIVGGLTIGPGAIVGAGAVVVRDVAPYTVVAGNPAKPVRRRFDDATCERLERIAWWDWPPEIVRANWRAFTAPIEDFVARFDPGGSASSG